LEGWRGESPAPVSAGACEAGGREKGRGSALTRMGVARMSEKSGGDRGAPAAPAVCVVFVPGPGRVSAHPCHHVRRHRPSAKAFWVSVQKPMRLAETRRHAGRHPSLGYLQTPIDTPGCLWGEGPDTRRHPRVSVRKSQTPVRHPPKLVHPSWSRRQALSQTRHQTPSVADHPAQTRARHAGGTSVHDASDTGAFEGRGVSPPLYLQGQR